MSPDHRWFPASEELRERAYEKLLPPLVANIRTEVFAWRAGGYAGASPTSKALLRWWFETEHLSEHLTFLRSARREASARRSRTMRCPPECRAVGITYNSKHGF